MLDFYTTYGQTGPNISSFENFYLPSTSPLQSRGGNVKCPIPRRVCLEKLTQRMDSPKPNFVEMVSEESKSESIEKEMDEVEDEIQSILTRKQGMGSLTSLSPSIGRAFSGLRNSTSNLFRAFSHSPSPPTEDSEEGSDDILDLGISLSGFNSIMTPPVRTTNPIILNTPFLRSEPSEKKKNTTR